jgi:hypothetical protein
MSRRREGGGMARSPIGPGRQSGFRDGALRSSIAALVLAGSSVLFALAPASAASAAPSISPQTARGCSQNVCIYVEGSGTQVTYWSTTAALPASMCTVANYWANGVLLYEGNTKCGSSGGQVSSYWPAPGHFAAGTELCNTWTGIQGKPCETIE